MQYPLEEKIGRPDLLVGREKEFANFNKWISRIPEKLSKSRVILARRKSGKTTFVQRIFNQLWSANGQVIPFYFVFEEGNIWKPNLAVNYFRAFASQYISFFERDADLVGKPFSLEQIRAYGETKGIQALVDDVDSLQQDEAHGRYDLMWITACNAPHSYASIFNQRVLVILDEFQNCAVHVYPDPNFQTKPIESMPGSYHSLSESKVAPMLVVGSSMPWSVKIMDKTLPVQRFAEIRFSPSLTPEEGLQTVYNYAEVYQEPITLQTAQQINECCMADPFFIACVIQSKCPSRNLTTSTGVIETINYEVNRCKAEILPTGGESTPLALKQVNDPHAKRILLHLCTQADREWTPRQIKSALSFDLSESAIHEKLFQLADATLIEEGTSNIGFHGLKDDILNLVLCSHFEQSSTNIIPNHK